MKKKSLPSLPFFSRLGSLFFVAVLPMLLGSFFYNFLFLLDFSLTATRDRKGEGGRERDTDGATREQKRAGGSVLAERDRTRTHSLDEQNQKEKNKLSRFESMKEEEEGKKSEGLYHPQQGDEKNERDCASKEEGMDLVSRTSHVSQYRRETR